MTLIQALVWNVGNCALMVRRRLSRNTARVPKQSTVTDWLIVVTKSL